MNSRDSSSRQRVVIVGGGLAGLSASEALARHYGQNFDVTLLESKRTVGGRAGSFSDPASGESIDYCQHVAMGCCTNLLGLLDRNGLSEAMSRYRELQFLHPNHSPSRFAPSGILPAPLHLSRALSALKYLNTKQQRQIRNGLFRLLRTRHADFGDQTAAQWLRNVGQSEESIRDFWSVIIVSALGEQAEVVSMSAVGKVFVDGFVAARGASDVLIPNLPLSQLVGQHLRAAIESNGVRVLTGKQVKSISETDGGSEGAPTCRVVTSDGESFTAHHVIVAVPWYCVADVLPTEMIPDAKSYARIPTSPITGIHLWFDREITERPHAVMVGTIAQWLFRQPWRDVSQSDAGCYYQVVISASQQAREFPREALVEAVVDELRHAFPDAKDASLLRSRVVTDPKSVFSIRPAVETLRPSPRTALPWLHLAGDWIATGWPATMEGAVISGILAASGVTERTGLGPIEVDPGLPRGWLARQLIRLTYPVGHELHT